MENKHNPIKTWCKAEGRSAKWLADQVGVTPSHLSRIGKGTLTPSRALALALQAVSGGGISADDLVQS